MDEFHLSSRPPNDHQLAPGKTFYGVQQWYYEQKREWYRLQGYDVLDDADYDARAAARSQPLNVRADTRTPIQRELARQLSEQGDAILDGSRPPEMAVGYMLQIENLREGGSVPSLLFTTGSIVYLTL